MERWQYLVEPVRFDSALSSRESENLNELGRQGWELVTIQNNRYYFKRMMPKEK